MTEEVEVVVEDLEEDVEEGEDVVALVVVEEEHRVAEEVDEEHRVVGEEEVIHYLIIFI